MTRDDLANVRDDIAYMRALAEEGRRAPLLGGSVLIAAGLIFGTASLVNYGVSAGVLTLSTTAYAVIWAIAMLVFFVVLAVVIQRTKGRPGAQSPGNKAVGAGWMGVGLLVFTMWLTMMVLTYKTQSGAHFALFPSLIFAAYGGGWAVSATMSGQRWQWALAIGAWAAAPLVALLIGHPTLWLAYAAGLFLLALAPGVIMVRQEPAEVV